MDYTLHGKRRRKIVADKKKDAELIRAKLMTDFALGRYELLLDEKEPLSLQQAFDNFLSDRKHKTRESTRNRYHNYFREIEHFFSKYFSAVYNDISLMKPTYYNELLNHLMTKGTTTGRKWSPKTLNGMKTLLVSIFQLAMEQEYISKNPLSKTPDIPNPKKGEVEYFTDEQLRLIWKELDEKWVKFFKFITLTGLRNGEIINLTWKNLKLDSQNPRIIITSGEKWTTKTGNTRSIPLSKNAQKIIENQKDKHKEFVFTDEKGNPVTKDLPLKRIKKALKKIGLEGNVHKFRHTFASHFMMKKAGTIYELSKLLGHTSIETTEIYAHLDPEYVRKGLDNL